MISKQNAGNEAMVNVKAKGNWCFVGSVRCLSAVSGWEDVERVTVDGQRSVLTEEWLHRPKR